MGVEDVVRAKESRIRTQRNLRCSIGHVVEIVGGAINRERAEIIYAVGGLRHNGSAEVVSFPGREFKRVDSCRGLIRRGPRSGS